MKSSLLTRKLPRSTYAREYGRSRACERRAHPFVLKLTKRPINERAATNTQGRCAERLTSGRGTKISVGRRTICKGIMLLIYEAHGKWWRKRYGTQSGLAFGINSRLPSVIRMSGHRQIRGAVNAYCRYRAYCSLRLVAMTSILAYTLPKPAVVVLST